MRIGIECGGTFTDYVALNEEGGLLAAGKVFSTPDNPARAVAEALDALPDAAVRESDFVHGSTVATNSLIERKGARIALVTTKGFRDIALLQRQDRESMYDLRYQMPAPIVQRDAIFEADERIDSRGRVVRALTEEAARTLIDAIVEAGYEAVAISFIHAYANNIHERLLGEQFKAIAPTLAVSMSSSVSPEFREFERTTTTTIDAFLKPRIARYLAALEIDASDRGIGSVHVMQSNGGMVPAEVAANLPLTMLRSGPAAGVAGAWRVAENAGYRDIVTMDMGGTSTDVTVILDGQIESTAETRIDGLPIRVPMVDIAAVGAGGGSLVSVDTGGLLTVGPESAGAMPGPVAYGRGGTEVTVTDANVVRGVIRPESFLGGEHTLDVDAATASLTELGSLLGRTAGEIASDIVRLASVHMTGAIRSVSTERGYEIGHATLVAYGGAGALHAADVADRLGMARVLVPPYAGMASAYGLLTAPFKREFSRTDVTTLGDSDEVQLAEMLDSIHHEALEQLTAEGVAIEDSVQFYSADMHYRGQGFEVSVSLGSSEVGRLQTPEAITAAFEEVHLQRYGYISSRDIQIVTLRLSVERELPTVVLPRISATRQPKRQTLPIIENGRQVDAQFEHRFALAISDQLSGPAVIEDDSSTTVVPTGWSARVDEHTNLILEKERA